MYKLGKNQNGNSFFRVISKNFFSIPVSVRIISFSSFLFVLGWGLGADIFFSIYVKEIIDNIFWIALIGGGMSAIRLIFTIPIGNLDDHVSMKSIMIFSKFFYIIAGFLYFFAGVFNSLTILIIAVVFNGFASSGLLTTYQAYIRHWINKNNGASSFGLFFSSFNIAYVIGALVAASFIDYIELKYVFLFIAMFAIISIFTDKQLPELKDKKKLHIFLKESFLHQFFREIFSFDGYKNAYLALKSAKKSIYSGLGFEFLFGVLNYIGFLFIPIISIQNNLSLSKVAIIFAIMRLPWIIDLVLGGISNKYNKKSFIMLILMFMAFLYTLLAYTTSFAGIIIISLGISLGLAIIRPVISSITSESSNKETLGSITGLEQFSGRLGDVFGAIGFGIISTIFSIKIGFVMVGALLFLSSFWTLIKKYVIVKKV